MQSKQLQPDTTDGAHALSYTYILTAMVRNSIITVQINIAQIFMIIIYDCYETLCMFLFLYTCIAGSPNCLTVNTTVTTSSLTVSIQNSQMMWLRKRYCAQVISYNGSIAITVYNSTLKDTTSFEVTSLEPDTVYNISVTPCNIAGCNESCDVHSTQTESEMSIEGEMSKQNVPLYTLLNQFARMVHLHSTQLK